MQQPNMPALIRRIQREAKSARKERWRQFQQERTDQAMQEYRRQQWRRVYLTAADVAHAQRRWVGLRGVADRLLGKLLAQLDELHKMLPAA